MEKAEKGARTTPRKPPAATILLMPSSIAALFIAASVGRITHLFPRWMSLKVESKFNLTSSQLMVIFLLSNSDELTLGQLSQMLELTPRAITGIMKGLHESKYITRRKDKDDQRITWVKLTPEGLTFFKTARPEIASKLSSLFSVLSKKEQVDLVRIIEKLTDHMKNQIDDK